MRVMFIPWKPFIEAVHDKDETRKALTRIMNEARNVFIKHMHRDGRGGRVYRRRGRSHQASAPGAYPASDSGSLANRTAIEIQDLTGAVGSNIGYAAYLYGTSKMAPRKMYDDALLEALEKSGDLTSGLGFRPL